MLRTAAIAAAGAAVAACLYALTRRPRLAFDLPGTMSAIVARDAACTVATVPTPQPAAGEVLIQVRATAINRLDVMQRRGKSPVPKGVTEVLGLEAAGIVVATSSAAFEVGDEVLALVPGGSYAEYVAVDATTVMRKPRSMSWAEAASVPEAWLTASLNLRLANVSPGETVLIHAAASGVGVASVQLARAAGARVLVTVGSAAKLELAQSLGASGGALRHDGPWLEAVRAAAPGGKVDAVLDCVAGAYAEQNVEALGVDGRWVLYSLFSGPEMPEGLAKGFLATLMKKRVQLLATTLRTRSRPFKKELVDAFAAQVLPHIGSRFHHVIDKEFDGLASAQAAHDYLESNANAGKVVLKVSQL
mmetsp:Transcript_1169/g.3481  ORF Transcript_1169/g.3481 Transcript_1169/m.3481 type:complete len:361 (-) Transcript_1169:149-1231(-)